MADPTTGAFEQGLAMSETDRKKTILIINDKHSRDTCSYRQRGREFLNRDLED